MAWDDLDLGHNTRFRSLWVALSWVEAHCVIPDGFRRGDWFDLVKWQAIAYLNHYRVKPEAQLGQLGPAFHNQVSMIVLPQKAGKAPFSSSRICLEGVGPALFAGWAGKDDGYACSEHGCGCGWEYAYQRGEPMGQRWPTPLVQITATSEDQTGNIYTALRPMIEEGPLADLIPKTGEDFIRLPNNGRIDPVTSNGRSRLGQRVTDIEWDEPGLYLRQNKMYGFSEAVFDTQWRGVTAMNGRGCLTTNAWDPTQDSAAKMVAELAASHDDVYLMHPMAPKGLKYTVRAERRKIHRFVYEGCPWIDFDSIEGLAAKLIARDPGQAERFLGNRPVAGEGVAFDMDVIEALTRTRTPPAGATIVIGADGALYDDDLAVIGVEVKTGHIFPLGIWSRPDDAPDDYKHPRHEVDGVVREAYDTYNVWRLYGDEQWIEELMNGWANEFGSKRVTTWLTNRWRQIAWAVRHFEDAIVSSHKELLAGSARTLTIEPNKRLLEHFANTRKRTLETVKDDEERPMHTYSKESTHSPLKIDGVMGAVLGWKCRGDAIEDGVYIGDDVEIAKPEQPQPWRPGYAPPTSQTEPHAPVGPMGFMS